MQALTTRSVGVVLALTGATVLLSACANRPDPAELTASIQRAAAAEQTVTLSDAEAACIAQRILDSELSDTTVAGLAEDFDNPEVLQTEVDQVEPLIAQAAAECRGVETE